MDINSNNIIIGKTIDVDNLRKIIELRRMGYRQLVCCGYDVVNDVFFAEEKIWDFQFKCFNNETKLFGSFDEYYYYLNGEIFENCCYYQCTISKEILMKYRIEEKFNSVKNIESLIQYTIDDESRLITKHEEETYKRIEKTWKSFENWKEKFNKCNSLEEILNLFTKYSNSKPSEYWDKSLLAEDLIVNYVENGSNAELAVAYINHLVRSIGNTYELEKIILKYNKIDFVSSLNLSKDQLNKLHLFYEDINNGSIEISCQKYFSKRNHMFCLTKTAHNKHRTTDATICCRDFSDFVTLLNGDLRNANLSHWIVTDIDFSKYQTDDMAFPYSTYTNWEFSIDKSFNRHKNTYEVTLKWLTGNETIEIRSYSFAYFFDFVYFLKNDLSNAYLLHCKGLLNLKSTKGMKFDSAILESKVKDFLKIPYEVTINDAQLLQVEEICSTETKVLTTKYDEKSGFVCPLKILYISDLHLRHRIFNDQCKTPEDITVCFEKIVDSLRTSIYNQEELYVSRVLLIGGDTADDPQLFDYFLSLFTKEVYFQRMIVILGNHEFWNVGNVELRTIDSVVSEYKSIASKYNVVLLHNEIAVFSGRNQFSIMDYNDLRDAKDIPTDISLAIVGGVGFAAKNDKYNANLGIYRNQHIDRNTEILESKKFDDLYELALDKFKNTSLIVLTHMPLVDWASDSEYKKGVIYVNGHTHINAFNTDGSYFVYSDNQIGYQLNPISFKYFYVDMDYDLFVNYDDGIYNISREDYINFLIGRGLYAYIGSKYKLLMLKKDGYYCFIRQTSTGRLSILNGGAPKSLPVQNIQYYYDHMGMQIKALRAPLDQYMRYQEKVSRQIISIGGSGTIHGAIVDIDFFNHVFVNPNDGKLTYYYATDIVNKVLYPSMRSLLVNNAPYLLKSYDLNKNSTELMGVNRKIASSGVLYTSTDMYADSRLIKKFQKLNNGVLTVWNENLSVNDNSMDLLE